jgi:hypothetical protein
MTRDAGLWATWYDLDAEETERFSEWLHGVYLPHLERDDRYAWVAHYRDQDAIASETGVAGPMKQAISGGGLASGSQYLVLVAAPSPRAFFNPLTLDSLDQEVPDSKVFLSLRRNVRHAVFVEEEAVEGPDSPVEGSSSLSAPAIRLGCFNMQTSEDDFEAGCWYAQDRLPHMAEAEGCVRARKLVGTAGWAKHAILYEFASPDARHAIWNDLRASRDRDPGKFWSIGPKTVHAPGSPTLGERTYPAW